LLAVPKATDALVSMARPTGDPTRDVAAATLNAVRAIAPVDADRDEQALGRIFGEDLPSGLVLA
jgi:hypothetical protein